MKHLSTFIKESIDPDDRSKVRQYLKEVDNMCEKLQKELGKSARIVSGSSQGGYEVEISIYKDAGADMKSYESIFAEVFGSTYESCCQDMDFEPEGCEYTDFWYNAYEDDKEIDMSCIVDLPDYDDMLANVPCLAALLTASLAVMSLGSHTENKCNRIIDDFVMKVNKI